MSVRLDHGEDALDVVHDINVTPFIDVMLVLLIIFMIAAPPATVDVAPALGRLLLGGIGLPRDRGFSVAQFLGGTFRF